WGLESGLRLQNGCSYWRAPTAGLVHYGVGLDDAAACLRQWALGPAPRLPQPQQQYRRSPTDRGQSAVMRLSAASNPPAGTGPPPLIQKSADRLCGPAMLERGHLAASSSPRRLRLPDTADMPARSLPTHEANALADLRAALGSARPLPLLTDLGEQL